MLLVTIGELKLKLCVIDPEINPSAEVEAIRKFVTGMRHGYYSRTS